MAVTAKEGDSAVQLYPCHLSESLDMSVKIRTKKIYTIRPSVRSISVAGTHFECRECQPSRHKVRPLSCVAFSSAIWIRLQGFYT